MKPPALGSDPTPAAPLTVTRLSSYSGSYDDRIGATSTVTPPAASNPHAIAGLHRALADADDCWNLIMAITGAPDESRPHRSGDSRPPYQELQS
jgi:hypothetical protein